MAMSLTLGAASAEDVADNGDTLPVAGDAPADNLVSSDASGENLLIFQSFSTLKKCEITFFDNPTF